MDKETYVKRSYPVMLKKFISFFLAASLVYMLLPSFAYADPDDLILPYTDFSQFQDGSLNMDIRAMLVDGRIDTGFGPYWAGSEFFDSRLNGDGTIEVVTYTDRAPTMIPRKDAPEFNILFSPTPDNGVYAYNYQNFRLWESFNTSTGEYEGVVDPNYALYGLMQWHPTSEFVQISDSYTLSTSYVEPQDFDNPNLFDDMIPVDLSDTISSDALAYEASNQDGETVINPLLVLGIREAFWGFSYLGLSTACTYKVKQGYFGTMSILGNITTSNWPYYNEYGFVDMAEETENHDLIPSDHHLSVNTFEFVPQVTLAAPTNTNLGVMVEVFSDAALTVPITQASAGATVYYRITTSGIKGLNEKDLTVTPSLPLSNMRYMSGTMSSYATVTPDMVSGGDISLPIAGGTRVIVAGSYTIPTNYSAGTLELLSTSVNVDSFIEMSTDYETTTPGNDNYWALREYSNTPTGTKMSETGSEKAVITVNSTQSYIISYDAQGGNGTMATQTALPGQRVTLSQNAFSRAGFTFQGWATSPAGGVVYGDGATLTMPTNNLTLYAVWVQNPPPVPPTYSVVYAAGGTDVTGLPGGASGLVAGANYTVSSAIPHRVGYSFEGWSASSGGTYGGGQGFTMPAANVILTAVWTALDTYTVSYNANRGAGPVPIDPTAYHLNDIVTVLDSPTPTRTGYTFQGWATSANATTAQYQAGSTFAIRANTTLYAVWGQTSSGGVIKPDTPSPDDSTPDNPLSQETVAAQAGAEGIPVLEFFGISIPLAAPQGVAAWSLMDLILMLFTVVMCVICITRAAAAKFRQRRAEGHYEYKALEESTKHGRRTVRPIMVILSVVAAGTAVILFFLTQDIRLPLVLFDLWTLAFAFIFVGALTVMILCVSRKKEEGEVQRMQMEQS